MRMNNTPAATRAPDVDPRALNSYQHGIFTQVALLPDEDPDERRHLEESYVAYFKPREQPELDVVLDIVNTQWRLRRLERAQAALMADAVDKVSRTPDPPLLDMAIEIQHMEIEVGILEGIVDRLSDEAAKSDGHLDAMLVAMLPVLGRLVPGQQAIASAEMTTQLSLATDMLTIRTAALREARATLETLYERHRVRNKAMQAQATLLDEKMALRLAQERTTLSRHLDRKLAYLRSLRDWNALPFPGQGERTDFHGASPDCRREPTVCGCKMEGTCKHTEGM